MTQPDTHFRFTTRALEKLPIPVDEGEEYSDALAVGLRFYIGTSGCRSWRYRYRFEGKKGSVVLGHYPATPLDEARELAWEKERMRRDGIDPKAEKKRRRECPTFEQFVDEVYLPFAEQERKSIVNIKSQLNTKLLPTFGAMKLIHIERSDVIAFVEKLAKDVSGTTANRARSLLSAILEMSIYHQIIETNPAKGIRKCKENGPRVTFMRDDALTRFYKELVAEVEKESVTAEAIYGLFATGMRSKELRSLRWDQVDLDNAVVYLPDPKNGVPTGKPLNSLALKLFSDIYRRRGQESEFVFPGRGEKGYLVDCRKTLKKLKDRAGVSDLVPHDFRRLFATILANNGENLRNIGSLLGHRNLRTTEEVYAHLVTPTLRTSSETFVGKVNALMADNAATTTT